MGKMSHTDVWGSGNQIRWGKGEIKLKEQLWRNQIVRKEEESRLWLELSHFDPRAISYYLFSERRHIGSYQLSGFFLLLLLRYTLHTTRFTRFGTRYCEFSQMHIVIGYGHISSHLHVLESYLVLGLSSLTWLMPCTFGWQ